MSVNIVTRNALHGRFNLYRICPGINIALRLLYLNIARLLWAFEFHPVLDEFGNPVLPCETEVDDDGATV